MNKAIGTMHEKCRALTISTLEGEAMMWSIIRAFSVPSAYVLTMHVAFGADYATQAPPITNYVKVCPSHGVGFFFIPGTDTCLRVSGRARFEATYAQSWGRGTGIGDTTGYRGLGRLNLDARTNTAYGALRSFVRLELASRTGASLASGTLNRIGTAFPAMGVDTFSRAQTSVAVDKAFIQFAGLTAGRAASFYDFYAHDYEIIGNSLGSDVASTNLLAYTAKNDRLSATISMEDPIFRKTPLFGNAATSTNLASQYAVYTNPANVTPIIAYNAAGGQVGLAYTDVIQRSRLPDFVAALRYDDQWGSAQFSAATHEINTGNASFIVGLGGPATAANAVIAPRPQTTQGWAVQSGLKVNLPFIAAGDGFYLQSAYGRGSQSYVGYSPYLGSYINSVSIFQGAEFPVFMSDAVVNPATGRLDLSRSWTIVGSFLHYFTPELRSTIFASYGQMSFEKSSRAELSSLNFNGLASPITNPVGSALTNVLRDTNQFVAGGNLIWSPVRDLDIGVEGIYAKVALQSGRVVDLNKNPGGVAVGLNAAGQPVNAAGAALRTVNSSDTFQVRMRIQRDF